MNEIVQFEYRGERISGNRMLNATEMAKPFGKPVGNFLRLEEAKRYIEMLELRYSDVNIGGNPKEEAQEHFNEKVKSQLEATAQRLDDLESKIISSDENYYPIAGYCNLKHIACPLHLAKAWGKQAASLSRERDIAPGTAHDERFGAVRTYHREILEAVIK